MYCKVEIVLQGEAGLYCSLRENCIARVALYCNREDWAGKILYCRLGGVVLQDCIARGLQENCIAIRKLYCDSRGLRQGLYYDTARCRATIRHAGRSRRAQGALGARGAPGRPGRQQGSLGAQAGVRGARRQALCRARGRRRWRAAPTRSRRRGAARRGRAGWEHGACKTPTLLNVFFLFYPDGGVAKGILRKFQFL